MKKAIAVMFISAVLPAACFAFGRTNTANSLRTGKDSAISKTIEIALAEPQSFNFKTRSEIFSLRRNAVAAYPLLFKKPYAPSPAVFGQIADGKPWWGQDGLFLYGYGQDSIKGRSERSSMILNPYLLVDCMEPDTSFIAVHNLPSTLFLNARNADTSFSYFPRYSQLLWTPAQSKAEVTYDVTGFSAFILKIAGRNFLPGELNLTFRMANARDWGFAFSSFDLPASVNMTQTDGGGVLQNKDFFHLGGTCGYEKGCNNYSPYQRELSNIHITKLPAVARFKLWRNKPASAKTPPDFLFDVKFK